MFTQHAKCQQNIFCHVVIGPGYGGANCCPFIVLPYCHIMPQTLWPDTIIIHIILTPVQFGPGFSFNCWASRQVQIIPLLELVFFMSCLRTESIISRSKGRSSTTEPLSHLYIQLRHMSMKWDTNVFVEENMMKLIVLDKVLFKPKSTNIFLISLWKHPLWEILFRSRHFWVPTKYLCRNKKNIMRIPFFFWRFQCIFDKFWDTDFYKCNVSIRLCMRMWQGNSAMQKKSKKNITHSFL